MTKKLFFALCASLLISASACSNLPNQASTYATISDSSVPSSSPMPISLEELPEKYVPGCRITMPKPLKMTGESIATDFKQWTTTDINGTLVTQDILKDSKLTLVFVWGTFCGSSIDNLALLEELTHYYSNEDLNVIGIVVSAQAEDGSVLEDEIQYVNYLCNMTGATFLQLLPSNDLIAIKLQDLDIVPETFLLDLEGNLIGESYMGKQTIENYHEMVENGLKHLQEANF